MNMRGKRRDEKDKNRQHKRKRKEGRMAGTKKRQKKKRKREEKECEEEGGVGMGDRRYWRGRDQKDKCGGRDTEVWQEDLPLSREKITRRYLKELRTVTSSFSVKPVLHREF